jgi:hypothetical protein
LCFVSWRCLVSLREAAPLLARNSATALPASAAADCLTS